MNFTEDSTTKFEGKMCMLFLKNGKVIKERINLVVWEGDDDEEQYIVTDKMLRHFSNIKEIRIIEENDGDRNSKD